MKFNYKIIWNRYVIILMVFVVWMLFFDQNNLFRQLQLRKEIRNAQAQKEFYLSEVKKDSLFLEQLKNDPEVKEKYAREHYKMAKDGEIVFSIIREKNE
ncbi:MAG TPA: septum formation initiator family protein, partial [Bacteroidales bacterium]|nr:septum formation initiator family protein [Bacteroidales bacterium]HPR58812.1 septum formation initiator family protein [Bacteroidales bacterium]HRW97413.1 septum formation initiator family protein [Bacteroidales bacterium]